MSGDVKLDLCDSVDVALAESAAALSPKGEG